MNALGLRIAILAAAACSAAPPPAPMARAAPRPARITAGDLPGLERWRHHVTDDILVCFEDES